MEVQPATKPLTQPVGCVQNSKTQAMMRKEFEEKDRQRRADEKRAEDKANQAKAAEAEAEVKRMRREHMAFKAKPVRHFKDVTNVVEQADLTIPKTPKLATKARAGQRPPAQSGPTFGI